MSNVIPIIIQALAEPFISFIITIVLLVAASLASGVSIRKLWRQKRLIMIVVVLAVFGLISLFYYLLISPASAEIPIASRPNGTMITPKPAPTRYSLERPNIGTPTWTPSATHTPTSTATPTYTYTPTPTPTFTATPTYPPSPTVSQILRPSPTPIPPCFGEGGFFYFEKPTMNDEFIFGYQIPITVRLNYQVIARLDYKYYSIHWSSIVPKDLPIEKWEVVKGKTSLAQSLEDQTLKNDVIYHSWAPPRTGTFWISAAFYNERGQYSAESLNTCAVKIVVR